MSENPKDIELVDRYLRGELSDAEKQEYVRRLESDKEFKNLHEEQLHIKKGIVFSERRELKEYLSEIDAEMKGRDSYKPKWASGFRAAAGLLILLASATVLYLFTAQSPYAKLYDTYFDPPAILEAVPVRGINTTEEATEAYNNGDFEEAEQLFNQALDRQQDDRVLYYLAITKMRLEKYGEAENDLQRILQAGDNMNIDAEARWYLALIYTKQGDKDLAVPLLQRVSSSDSRYREDALRLLQEIKQEN